MNYYLFYYDFALSIMVLAFLIIGLIIFCINVKHNEKYTLFNFAIIIGVAILSIVVVFRMFIPSLKDYSIIKHNNFSVMEGIITEKIHVAQDPTYCVIINNKQLKVSYDDYSNIIINKNYRITYLPYSKIAIEVDAK